MQRKELLNKTEVNDLRQRFTFMFSLKALGEDYMAEYRYIRKRTEELLYRIPTELFLADEDTAGQVFIRLHPFIDKIIFSYRITRCTNYVDYLAGVVRFRMISLDRDRRRHKAYEDGYMRIESLLSFEEVHCQDPAYTVSRFDDHPFERELVYGPGTASKGGDESKGLECGCPTRAGMDAWLRSQAEAEALAGAVATNPSPEAVHTYFQVIVHHEPSGHCPYSDKRLKALHGYLSDFRNRRDFLFLLMSDSGGLDPVTVENMALLLDVDPALMAAFDSCCHEARQALIDRENEINRIRNRHWVRYTAIANSLEREVESGKKEELCFLQEVSLKRLKAKCDELNGLRRSFSVRQMAQLTHCSPTTVSRGVNQARKAIQACCGQ